MGLFYVLEFAEVWQTKPNESPESRLSWYLCDPEVHRENQDGY